MKNDWESGTVLLWTQNKNHIVRLVTDDLVLGWNFKDDFFNPDRIEPVECHVHDLVNDHDVICTSFRKRD